MGDRLDTGFGRPRPRIRKPAIAHVLALGTVFGTFIVAAAAVRVGHAGGQLVYAHNAGAVSGSAAQPSEAQKGTRECCRCPGAR